MSDSLSYRTNSCQDILKDLFNSNNSDASLKKIFIGYLSMKYIVFLELYQV